VALSGHLGGQLAESAGLRNELLHRASAAARCIEQMQVTITRRGSMLAWLTIEPALYRFDVPAPRNEDSAEQWLVRDEIARPETKGAHSPVRESPDLPD